MDTLGELVARERRSDATAIRTDPADRAMSYHDFCTTAWKAGNFLRYLGVRSDDRVVVADDPRPEPVLALFGAALLGARVRFWSESPPNETDPAARVVVAPAEQEHSLDLPPETRLLVYGGPPEQSRTAHWEGDVWSENPAFPPTTVDPRTTVLETGERTLSHAALLEAADDVARAADLDTGTTVCVRESMVDPGVVVGVLAPLLVEATVVFPDKVSACDVDVGGDDSDSRSIDPATALDGR